MTNQQALTALDKAIGLTARAQRNYDKATRSVSGVTKTSREAWERYERYSQEAEELFETVRRHLGADQ